MSDPFFALEGLPELSTALRPLEAWTDTPPPAPSWAHEAAALRPEPQRIPVRGAEIEILSWGRRGDPGLLLAHGARAHAGWWSLLAPALAAGRRVTALSWSGMGGSDWRDAYDLDLYTEEAMAAAEAGGLFEGPVLPVFLGHSFGGYVMVRLARRHGARLRRVITLDAGLAAFRHPPIPGPVRTYGSRAEALARFRLEPPQAAWPYMAYWFADHGLRRTSPDEVSSDTSDGASGRWTWRFDPDVFAKMGEVSIWDDIPGADCPMVFIRGEKSHVAARETEDRLRGWAPRGSRFLTIPGASHHPMAEDPLGLIDLLSPLC